VIATVAQLVEQFIRNFILKIIYRFEDFEISDSENQRMMRIEMN
tara:strand:- start:8503 stop:8634 length:132 start_codon:yes stop_codon:yes gene_type:complete